MSLIRRNSLNFFSISTKLLGLSLCVATFCGQTDSAFAQRSYGGSPLAQQSGLRASEEVPKMVLLDFNPADEWQQSLWSTKKTFMPILGRVIACPISFASEAQEVGTVKGHTIYRLHLNVEGDPVGTVLYYKDFFIPQGGRLYLYDSMGHTLLGAYTHATHPWHGSFATEPLSGGDIVLEYEAPIGGELPSIEIEGVGYLFQNAMGADSYKGNLDASDPYTEKICQVNVNCEQGNEWKPQAAGVVTVLQLLKRYGTETWFVSSCSGNVMNNSAQDFKPYVLTAAHCAGEDIDWGSDEGQWQGGFEYPQDKLDQWVFGFHFERPRCTNADYASYHAKTLVGCYARMYNSIYFSSDALLLELQEQIPKEWRVYYNGFDASEAKPQSGAGIHHPSGDSKKIALFDGGVKIGKFADLFASKGSKDDFVLKFQEGRMEGGSSGSSLFNQDGLVVGTLSGGDEVLCVGKKYYGRMSSHWDKYATPGSTDSLHNLSAFLDPKGQGRVLQGTWREGYLPLGIVNTVATQVDQGKENISLTWEKVPEHPQGYPISYRIYRFGELIQEQTENKFSDPLTEKMLQNGTLSYQVAATYQIEDEKVETAPAYAAVYVGTLSQSVRDMIVTSQPSGEIRLTWQPPLNAQVISKSPTSRSDSRVATLSELPSGKNDDDIGPNREYWLTDTWRTELIAPGIDMYLSQLNYIPPQADKEYTLLVHQRGMPAVKIKDVVPADYPQGEMRSILLPSPHKVNREQPLLIGYVLNKEEKNDFSYYPNSQDDLYAREGTRVWIIYIDDMTDAEGIRDFSSQVWNTLNPVRMGYLAVDAVLTDSNTPLTEAINSPLTLGRYISPFPKVLGYEIYQNGRKVGRTEATEFTLNQGTESDRYEIVPLYEYGQNEVIDRLHLPEALVYPSCFTDQLHIAPTLLVQEVQIYDLQSQLVWSAQGDVHLLEVSHLPEGKYLLQIKTSQGIITERIFK